MKQKTAMMKLIEQLNSYIYSVSKETILDRGYGDGLTYCRNLAEQLLEKEKEDMVLFSVKMSQRDGSNTGIDIFEDEAIAYYNQTYKQD